MSGPIPRQDSLHCLCNNFAGSKPPSSDANSTGLVPNPPWLRHLLERHCRHFAAFLDRNLARDTMGHESMARRRHELQHSLCRAILFRDSAALALAGRRSLTFARSPGRLPSRSSGAANGPAHRDGVERQLLRWLI